MATIAQKYSNLSQFRYTWNTKFSNLGQVEAQQKYTLVAQEAMHNVLSIVLSSHDAKHDRAGTQWREACFESLFMLGFWKKLLFLVDAESGMQLAWACNDASAFKLLFLVNKFDAPQIKQCLSDTHKFKEALSQTQQSLSPLCGDLAELVLAQDQVSVGQSGNFLDYLKKCKGFDGITGAAAVGSLAASSTQKGYARQNKITKSLSEWQANKMVSLISQLFLSNDNIKVRRAFFRGFGVSLLDGLDAFSSF